MTIVLSDAPDDSVLLSITIPTFNRVIYLRELLAQVAEQVEHTSYAALLEVLVIDNASTDGTSQFLQDLSFSRFHWTRNSRNIGGNANFCECVKRARGTYVWILGDDELLEKDAIDRIIHQLLSRQHGLVVLGSEGNNGLGGRRDFEDYRELIAFSVERNPHFILQHTLISANVFRRKLFDIGIAMSKIGTSYGHMYGLVHGLAGGSSVYILDEPTIKIRAQRAPFEVEAPLLGPKQSQYVLAVSRLFGNEALARHAIRQLASSLLDVPNAEFRRVVRAIAKSLKRHPAGRLLVNTVKRIVA